MSGASSCCLLLWNMCQNGVVWNHLQAWHLIQLICFNQQICTDFYGHWSLLSWTKQSLRMRFVCLNFHGPRWPNARNASCTHFHHPQHLPQPDASEVWSGRKPHVAVGVSTPGVEKKRHDSCGVIVECLFCAHAPLYILSGNQTW